jgi:hypothetical protein
MGGMINNMKKYILQTARKMRPFGSLVFDATLPKIRVGYNFEGIALIVIVYLFPCTPFVNLPHPELSGLFHNAGIPDMMGI